MKHWFITAVIALFSITLHADPLPASEVFQVQIKRVDPNTFQLDWSIKEHYFLYRDRIALTDDEPSNVEIGDLRLPKALVKVDKQGREYLVYRKQLVLPVSILGIVPGESWLHLKYQGCSDDGYCYPPESKRIKIAINPNHGIESVLFDDSPASKPVSPAQELGMAEAFNHSWWVIFFMFYGFGLLLSFTPCILPMVPVLSGIIVGHGKDITTRKAFFLSLSYVLSMSVTYAIAGAVVALLGANLQISMQSPWAISLFSLIFIALALSMFGFYEFRLPESWQARIAGSSRSQRGGHYVGAAIMGCLSTLILSPCVTAPLIAVLTYIAQTGNVVLGSLTLFILSLGMGTPLLLIGTSAGRWLPSAGSWMNVVKACFGVLFIAVAIFLLQRILPGVISMGLWALLFIATGVFAGALTHSDTPAKKAWQSTGLFLLAYGILLLVGASMGQTNPLMPLKHRANPGLSSKPLKNASLADIEQRIKEAKGRPVMLEFSADWCTSCTVMELTTLADPKVKAALSKFTTIKIDLTQNTRETQAIMSHFKVIAPPAFMFFDSNGMMAQQATIVGEVDSGEFLKTLSTIN